MKKFLIVGIFVFLTSTAFAYTPTSTDEALLQAIYPAFDAVVESDMEKGQEYITQLSAMGVLFETKEPRFSYIFSSIASHLKETLRIVQIIEPVVLIGAEMFDNLFDEINQKGLELKQSLSDNTLTVQQVDEVITTITSTEILVKRDTDISTEERNIYRYYCGHGMALAYDYRAQARGTERFWVLDSYEKSRSSFYNALYYSSEQDKSYVNGLIEDVDDYIFQVEREIAQEAAQEEIITTPTTTYSCGYEPYCTEIYSCQEAYYYLNTCGLSRLDGDSDGIPCESICGG